MSRPVAACPNCSAPVEFRWSSAVQTVCGHCRSVVVRHDVDLKAVGVVADLPLTGSPIQIGTRGRFQGDAFTVTGRIVYEYEHGTWNEWHLVFADDTSGWLSDAQAEYAVSRVVQKPASLPAAADLEVGQTFAFGDFTFQLTTMTRARYRGVEGELPFEYWDKDEVLFADFRTADGHFATLDYSETPPLLFIGAFVPFDELELKDLRPADTAPGEDRRVQLPQLRRGHRAAGRRAHQVGRVHELRRDSGSERPERPHPPGSAGARALRAEDSAGHARHAARPRVRGHRLPVPLHRRRRRAVRLGRVPALQPRAGVPLSQRVSGPLERHHHAAGAAGAATASGGPAAHYQGKTFKLFQTASATTDYVLGQFPWRVRAFDVAGMSDYVAPPLMLSAERTDNETTWSLGEYTTGAGIWKAFGLPGASAARRWACSRTSRRPTRARWRGTGVCSRCWLLLVAVGVVRAASAAREQVFAGSYQFPPTSIDSSFVADTFRVTPRLEPRADDRHQPGEQLDLLQLRADQQRHRRRARLRPRGQLLLRHRQRRAMDRRVGGRRRRRCRP